MIGRILRRLMPSHYWCELMCLKILARDYGHWKSLKQKACIDAEGNPIPWYTYPAIEYLKQFDFSGMTVFEYGSGNSSHFWAERAGKVFSVEDDKSWYGKVLGEKHDNHHLMFRPNKEGYVAAILEPKERFDIVVIDGNHRPECARMLPEVLKENALVILDNSDWFKRTAKYIREELDLIQVDFHGFGPTNPFTTTTSLFFSRGISLKPLNNDLPEYAIGGLKHVLGYEEDF